MDKILDFITLLTKVATLAVQVGADAAPFIAKIHAASAADARQPTALDFDELSAMEQTFNDQLNDTSGDDK